MDKPEVIRLIEHAKSCGLDPGKVLSWRLNFTPHTERRFERPKGMLCMGDAANKYGLTLAQLLKLRRAHKLPTTKKAQLLLVNEKKLREWMKRYPPSDAPPGRPRKPDATGPGR
jgi:hypothetical protein